MSRQVDKSVEAKNTLLCQNLDTIIFQDIDNDMEILKIFYTLIDSSFSHFLDTKDSSESVLCADKITNAIVKVTLRHKTFLKDTVEHFSKTYRLDSHSLHVAIYAVNLAYRLGLDDDDLSSIAMAAMFMDTGLCDQKIDITKETTVFGDAKPNIVLNHPKKSVEIAKKNHIYNPYVLEAILHHHERYDGSGYPEHLHGRNISTYAAILGICDTFDALTVDRPHRKSYTSFQALQFMLKDASMSGKFNQQYLKKFLQLFA